MSPRTHIRWDVIQQNIKRVFLLSYIAPIMANNTAYTTRGINLNIYQIRNPHSIVPYIADTFL